MATFETINDKAKVLSELGFTETTITYSEYKLHALAKLAAEDKWSRLLQTVKLEAKNNLVALVIQLIIENTALSQEFVKHVNANIRDAK
jgi:hypothetical protein